MKKKVGIMSMQRIVNYGSFLQAFGLKQILEELGFDVQFVDYKYEKPVAQLEHKSFTKKIMENINVFQFVKKKLVLNRFRKKYKKDYLPLLNVNQEVYNPDIDALVIGSDEVFNCLQGYPVGYSRELFGKNYENIDVISYAACFGDTTVEKLKKYNIDSEIGEMLMKFKSISVRDENSYHVVTSLTNQNVQINLDPVLISSYEKYFKKQIILRNYIVLYAYTGRLTKKEEDYIKKFAKEKKKKIVCLGMYQKIADYNLVVSPFEVLEYVKGADYVITDTFHGTIFSVVNHSKFCTIVRDTNKNKLTYLLDKLQLTSRIVNSIEDVTKLYEVDIDYSKTDSIISQERKKTIEYLKNNLK